MKIAVVMAYYQRQALLNKTLSTIADPDTKLAIVDDASEPELIVPEEWTQRTYSHTFLRAGKFWSFPAIPFNYALRLGLKSGADVLLLQSPECYHVGDVIGYVRERMRKGLYMTFACLSLSKEATENVTVYGREREIASVHKNDTCSNGPTGWFNHSVYRPCYLEFCLAIHRDDVISLNGYDERFADGVAVGDVDLHRRAKNLGLEMLIVDDPFVVHQWHYDGPNPYDDGPRFRRNEEVLRVLTMTEPENYRANLMFTGDLQYGFSTWRERERTT